jgi:carbonic anhydrase
MREIPFAAREEQLLRVTEYNVLQQIEHLMTHPSVHRRLRYGEIEIRGWVYDIGSGTIREFDTTSGKFEPIGVTS